MYRTQVHHEYPKEKYHEAPAQEPNKAKLKKVMIPSE